ncbi:MAG: hypothetical protein KTR31_22480 [Myxococcales bacterium]|nr:hypothetical protein [Myxococcales bacterium]
MSELLERIRTLYVEQLARALAETEHAQGEVALRHGTGEIGREGALDLGMRIDVVVVQDGEALRQFHVASSTRMQFEPVSVQYDTIQLELRPFAWDGATLQLTGQSLDLQPLVTWFTQWFGDEDAAGEDGLKGVVHFLSDPVEEPDGLSFEVDLGSAPVQALVTLLDAAVSSGATRVVIEG